MECDICTTDGDLALQGSLGSLSLSDLTPHGDLYRERFTTRGGEALVFNIHKYFSSSCLLLLESIILMGNLMGFLRIAFMVI